eukprot:GEMP01033210.1.p1 GENE.GEMP01033210.1~~GEMP01033210.1.p1  ORF type:complete len:181 (+),score=27.88 GEMP01033210.1:1483-2025(+)
MVPSGYHSSPSWQVSTIMSGAEYNPLLAIAGSHMFLRSLAKFCFAQAWWIRLLWLMKLLVSLPHKERVRELAGFITWTWRRHTRPYDGVFLHSLAGEIKAAQLLAPELTDAMAHRLLDLPTLYAEQGEDFRKNYKVVPDDADTFIVDFSKLAEKHIYPIKEYHALPEEWKVATVKWYQQV